MSKPLHSTLASTAASLSLAALTLSTTTVNAVEVTTDPVGVVNVTVTPKPSETRGLNLISIPLLRPAITSGRLTSDSQHGSATRLHVGSDIISLLPENLVTTPIYIEFASGNLSGLICRIGSIDGEFLVLQEFVEGGVSADTAFEIRPFWTLASAFPGGSGLKTGTTASVADNILMLNPDTGIQTSYFYHSINGRWQAGFSDASNIVIRPDTGIIIERKDSDSPKAIRWIGDVPRRNPLVFVGGDASPSRISILPNPFPVSSATLQNLNLYTGDSSTGLESGTTATNSDNLVLVNPQTGQQVTYFFHSQNNRWQSGFADASSVVIPAGHAVYVVRKNARSPFLWEAPKPY